MLALPPLFLELALGPSLCPLHALPTRDSAVPFGTAITPGGTGSVSLCTSWHRGYQDKMASSLSAPTPQWQKMQPERLQGFECQAKERGMARFVLLKDPGSWGTLIWRQDSNFSTWLSSSPENRGLDLSRKVEDGSGVTAPPSPSLPFPLCLCSQLWEFPCKGLGSKTHPHYLRAESKPQSPVM